MWRAQRAVHSRGSSWAGHLQIFHASLRDRLIFAEKGVAQDCKWLMVRLLGGVAAAPVYPGVDYSEFKGLNVIFSTVLLRTSFSRTLTRRSPLLQCTYRGPCSREPILLPPSVKHIHALAGDESQNGDSSEQDGLVVSENSIHEAGDGFQNVDSSERDSVECNENAIVKSIHEAGDESKNGDPLERDCLEGSGEAVEPSPPSVSKSLSSRINIPSHESVMPVVLDWIAEGNPPLRTDIIGNVFKLKKRRRFKHAMEITEWLVKEKPFDLIELDYALLIYFTGKTQGPEKAEKALLQLTSEMKKEVVFTCLLELYLEDENLKDAIHILRKIQELDIRVQPSCYNRLITLCHRNSLESKIPTLLKDMMKRGVEYNLDTYNTLINGKAKIYDIEGMEEVFELMKADPNVQPNYVTYSFLASAYLAADLLEKAEKATREIEKFDLRSMRRTKFDHLLVLYGSLGKLDDVQRVYKKIGKLPMALATFIGAIVAFGEAGSVERAELVVQKMVSKRGWQHVKQFNAILGVYSRHGMMEKAEEVVKNLLASGRKKNAITYIHLLEGYLRTGQKEKAEEIVKEVKNIQLDKKVLHSRAWLQSTLNIVDLFAENGDAKNAELFFQGLRAAKLTRLPKVYNRLLKAYVKAGKPADGFLLRMTVDQATPDAETHALLEHLDKFNGFVPSLDDDKRAAI